MKNKACLMAFITVTATVAGVFESLWSSRGKGSEKKEEAKSQGG
jgi:hypothetical protein